MFTETALFENRYKYTPKNTFMTDEKKYYLSLIEMPFKA